MGVTSEKTGMVGVMSQENVTLGGTNDESEMLGVRSHGNAATVVVRG
jgi:hypothetical protein